MMIEAGVEHTLFGIEDRALLQIADADVVSEDDRSRIASFHSVKNRHERRLARAVAGYESYFLSL